MPIEKILTKIRAQIVDCTPFFEMFTDKTLQPGVEDCEKLQQNLHQLLDQISVYKYNKQSYEVSPSFNLHAHISENTATAVPDKLEPPLTPKQVFPKADPPPPPEPAAPPAEKPAEKKQPEKNNEHKEPVRQLKALHIGLNDKFRFINELFAKNNAEYHIAMEQLSNLQTWPETDLYFNSLKNLYGWRENHDAVKHFLSIIKKRFQ